MKNPVRLYFAVLLIGAVSACASTCRVCTPLEDSSVWRESLMQKGLL